MPTSKDTLFIRIASERRLLTREQIAECRKAQRTLMEIGARRSLLEIAISGGYLTESQGAKLDELLERDGLP